MALTIIVCTIARVVSFGDGTQLLIWPGAAVAFAFGWHYHRGWVVPPAIGCGIWTAVAYNSFNLGLAGALCAGFGAVAAITVLRRFTDWKPSEYGLNAMLRFVFVTLVVAAPIDATIATIAVQALPGVWPASGHVWIHWWMIDALGMVLVTPALLCLLGNEDLNQSPAAPGRSDLDFFGLGSALMLAGLSLSLALIKQPFYAHAVMFLYFPLVAWVAIGNSTRVTVITLLASAIPLIASRSYQVRSQIGSHITRSGALDGFIELDTQMAAAEIGVLVFSATVLGLIVHAIASDRRVALHRVARQAREDLSTGLLNDRGLLKELDDLLNDPDRPTVGILGVHLTNFDSLTDLCGALQAQHLEQSTANLLRRQTNCLLASRTTAGRYVILVRSENVAQVRAIAREIYAQMTGQSFKTVNGSLRLQACVAGLFIDQHTAINSEEALSALIDALSIAASVRDPQLFVEPLSQTMIDARRTHQEKIEHIREAIRDFRIELFAQLIVDIKAPQQQLSYEILTRLRDPLGGLIQPAEFIPLAQQAQVSVALDRAVIQKTFEWLGRNRSCLDRTQKCSINLSGLTMGDASIASFIFSQRIMHDIPASKIVFEITESEAIRNPQAANRLVDSLKAEGFGIALDDFGTGLATFEYLKRFSIDYLKIDGSFVRSLKADSIDEEIVRATIRVAKHLNVKTVAEHVHQQSILDLLTQLGIDYIQGYLINMPEPLHKLFSDRSSPSRSLETLDQLSPP
jgi:EAL domain-containing protein (putative c-di-GMP-specific phosphodiesterase class I)/GGDEF domain-containing protein/integral membrane sensor domain MASE1